MSLRKPIRIIPMKIFTKEIATYSSRNMNGAKIRGQDR